MRFAIIFNSEELNKMQWPIIVENWKRVLQSNSRRAKYCNAFNNEERKIIYHYYKSVFSPWFYKSGTPNEREMPYRHYHLLIRAVQFFATIQ